MLKDVETILLCWQATCIGSVDPTRLTITPVKPSGVHRRSSLPAWNFVCSVQAFQMTKLPATHAERMQNASIHKPGRLRKRGRRPKG